MFPENYKKNFVIIAQVPITSVTIFNNTTEDSNSKRAEITRIFNVSLKPGINEIHLEDIAKTIVTNSISVFGHGHATILDFNRYTDDKKDVLDFKESEYGFNKTVGKNIMELLGFYEKTATEINTKIRESRERSKTLEDEVQAIKTQKTRLTISNSTKS
uniref:DUF4140 domain-containing protein n=1 Tax=Panagrolaimus davidi TaxID=227884 RepID=A0A914NY23_9BILA